MDKRLIFRYRSRTIKSQVCAGCARPSAVLEILRLTVQVLAFGQVAEAGESPSRAIRLTLASKKSTSGDAASARTANRHWWPGINVPRWTSDPSLRN